MKLYLDSTNNKKVIIRLSSPVIPSVVEESIKEYNTPQDQDVLGFLMKTLKLRATALSAAERGLSLQDVTEIEVNPGPGSFTGSRVGVTIANALALALNIKVNGQNPPVLPIYGSPPNISITAPSPSVVSNLTKKKN